MSTYIVIRKSDGAEVHRYAAEAPVEWGEFPFAEYSHDAAQEPAPDEPPADPPAAWHVTRRAFRNRFSQAEEVAIELAAIDNPTASMQVRAFAAVLRSNQRKISDGVYVDLKMQQTRDGVLGLGQAGLLAPGRAQVILDTRPTDEELYRG